MRILWLTPWFPYPPDNGIRIRLFNLLRALGTQHDITLLSFVREGERAAPEFLREVCRSVETVAWREYQPTRAQAVAGFLATTPRSIVDTYNREMDARVRQACATNSFDAIIASTLDVALYALKGTARVRVLEEHNCMTRWIQDKYRAHRGWLKRARYALTFLKYQQFERGVYARFDACTMVSELDARAARELLDYRKPLAVVPNAMDLEFYRATFSPQPNTLIFNGSLTYDANLDAMRFFAREIWSRIRADAPNATLRITGRANGASALNFDDGITLTGYLDDIRPAVGQAWACVAPLRTGGGTRLKILEAMALGTPVVTTAKGAEGLDVMHGENILIADTPAEFAAQTLALLRDANLRARLARNARQLVETHYSWERCGKQFEEFVRAQVAG
ncbi:MAG: glycosyltransferase [Chloroflexi bacterium]|nr:glycosyltransferase [Chloroflexota bacterium]